MHEISSKEGELAISKLGCAKMAENGGQKEILLGSLGADVGS